MTNWKDLPKWSFIRLCTGQVFLSHFSNWVQLQDYWLRDICKSLNAQDYHTLFWVREYQPEKVRQPLSMLCHDERWLLQSNLIIQEIFSDNSDIWTIKEFIISIIQSLSTVTLVLFHSQKFVFIEFHPSSFLQTHEHSAPFAVSSTKP